MEAVLAHIAAGGAAGEVSRMVRQVDVGGKPQVARHAEVVGELALGPRTRTAIRRGQVQKGDPLVTGELAGLLAMKRTPELIPHCHSVPLTSAAVDLQVSRRGVRVRAEAETVDRTGSN